MRWFAPGRVTLIGDHTDYQNGWVLPFAIAAGTTVNVEINDTFTLEMSSTHHPEHRMTPIDQLTAPSDSWAAYVEGAVAVLNEHREPSEHGVALSGARIDIDSDLPIGAGLSSSAALTCATLCAVSQALGRTPDPREIAALAQRVENEFVGAPVGYLDPAAVMFGRDGYAMVVDTRSRDIAHVPLPLASHDLTTLLFDSGRQHATTGTGYGERVSQCASAARQLGVASLRDVTELDQLSSLDHGVLQRRARHVVSENQRVQHVAELLRAGRVRDIGPHLTASHASLRDDFEVSTPALDAIVDAALGAGAQGARVTGAGFGGHALVLTDVAAAPRVVDAVNETFQRDFGRQPVVREVKPSAGARQLRP